MAQQASTSVTLMDLSVGNSVSMESEFLLSLRGDGPRWDELRNMHRAYSSLLKDIHKCVLLCGYIKNMFIILYSVLCNSDRQAIL